MNKTLLAAALAAVARAQFNKTDTDPMTTQDKNLDREGGEKAAISADGKFTFPVNEGRAQPQACAAVASDWNECERIADLPAVHEALTGFTQDPTGDNGTCVVRAVLEAISGKTIQAGASGAGEDEVLALHRQLATEKLPKWIDDLKGRDPTIDGLIEHIIGLRAQLARQQAPVGESIDTPEFRKLLAAVQGWHDGEPVMEGDAQDLIAHIDAQLARQRQGEPVAFHVTYDNGTSIDYRATRREADALARELDENGWPDAKVRPLIYGDTTAPSAQQEPAPTDLSKRLRDSAARPTILSDLLRQDLIAAADEIERLAAQQEQGDAVRDAALHFADEAINCAFDGGSLDGGTIQEMAEKLGLLKRETMREPCGEGCRCADSVPFFPVECFRKTYRAAPAHHQ